MIQRIWLAYRLELSKALRLKFTYVGPALVLAAVLCAPLMSEIERDGASDYGFIAFATPLALDLLGILLILVFCAGLVSSELGSGTIRMVLVRPVRRHEFLAAKLVLGATYAATLTALVAVASWSLAFGLGELRGVTYGGELLFTGREMAKAYLLGMLLGLAPQFAAVGYAVMISTLTRSTGAAIGSAVGIWIVLDVVKYPLRIAPFLFSSYLESPWQVFLDQCNAVDTAWFPSSAYCLIASGVSAAVFVGVSAYVLSRRNLGAC